MKRLRLPGVTPLEIWDAAFEGRPLFEWQETDRFGDALRFLTRGYERIFVMGGGAHRVKLPGAVVLDDPRFAAARAGSRFVRNGLCVDVGQTAIKFCGGGGASLLDRPKSVRESIGSPALLALPCEIDGDCNLGPCTYDLRRADFDGLDCLVLNDAELATLAVPEGPALVLTIGYGVGAALKR